VSQTLAARLLVPFASLAPIAPILWASTALAGDLTLQPKAGAPLTGLSPAELELFETGRQLYVTPLSPLMGLGPIFNKSNCGSCHSTPLGGWGSISVTHFGYEKKGEYVPLDRLAAARVLDQRRLLGVRADRSELHDQPGHELVHGVRPRRGDSRRGDRGERRSG
jgi:hypothetical protein